MAECCSVYTVSGVFDCLVSYKVYGVFNCLVSYNVSGVSDCLVLAIFWCQQLSGGEDCLVCENIWCRLSDRQTATDCLHQRAPLLASLNLPSLRAAYIVELHQQVYCFRQVLNIGATRCSSYIKTNKSIASDKFAADSATLAT